MDCSGLLTSGFDAVWLASAKACVRQHGGRQGKAWCPANTNRRLTLLELGKNVYGKISNICLLRII